MARLVVSPQLEHLVASVDVARDSFEPEAIHQVRVAGRRVKVWLRLAGYEALHHDLRWLIRGLGPLRDLDVLLDSPLANDGAFGRWLRAEHTAAKASAKTLLNHARLEGLLRALRSTGSAPRRQALEAAAGLATRAERQWQTFTSQRLAAPSEALFDQVHAVRRAARQARYAAEWTGADPDSFRAVQEAVGPVCDLVALRAQLMSFGAAADQRFVDGAIRRALKALHRHRGWP